MKLNELKPSKGSKKNRRRVGRGLGSGRGKTAGRGQKGQLSRSGYSKGPMWEGGRSRLFERLPKRGFNNNQFKTKYQIVNVSDLNKFEKGSIVNANSLKALGLVRRSNRPIKLLGDGKLAVTGLTVKLDNYSQSAIKVIESAEGKVIKSKALLTETAEENS